MTHSELIPITLLTGFLGSGKTTVLNHLVQQAELSDALVIINEFGEMALDHQLVAHSTENLIMEMSSGCLCCTIRGDLVQTLRDITWRFSRQGQRQFNRVLIETTGLADPAPILQTLMSHPQITAKYRLDGIVSTIDMATGLATLQHHPEAVKQAAMADVLLLSKADLCSTEQAQQLEQALQKINPAAPRIRVQHGLLEPANILNLGLFNSANKTPDVEQWLNEHAYAVATEESTHAHSHAHHHEHDINQHDPHIRAFCFAFDQAISIETLEAWMEILLLFMGSNILRIKGILNIQGHDRPLALHGVQHLLHPLAPLPAWPSADRRSRLVFITRDLSRADIETTFKAFLPSNRPSNESKP